MAVLDMFGNEIKKGDLVLFVNPKNHPLIVEEVKEPSLLGLNAQQVPVGQLRVSLNYGAQFPNPMRSPNVTLEDVMIVKGPAKEPPADTSKPN